MSFSCSACIT
ncbi:hypothetical protein EC960932_3010, partial [Escherichia coli 96.0932]